MHKLIIAPLLVVFLKSTAIFAQCDATTLRELVRISYVFTALGYTRTHSTVCDKLRDDNYNYHSLTLDEGWEYKITAACDGDCSDIDLVIYDGNGNKIDEDIERDDNPVVSATPKWTGTFRIKVIMADCKTNPCGYGIAVFGK
jgi:hypothetical protein